MNIDKRTVEAFGAEWTRFDQNELDDAERLVLFDSYFHIFPWHRLPDKPEGFDMGCGSGRWARLVAPKVACLNCIDPSLQALDVARGNLAALNNVVFLNAGVSDCPIASGSQDFGYSLGVLHHIPDTRAAVSDCVRMLKPCSAFLLYLYYRLDNRPAWYPWVWSLSNILRLMISRMPEFPKAFTTDFIAAITFFPLARISLLGQKLGIPVSNWLLSNYRNCSSYTIRTNSRDRFGTPLEQRFTRREIEELMLGAGLENIVFSDRPPFWCAVGTKRS